MSKYTPGPWFLDDDYTTIRENNKPNSDMNLRIAEIRGPQEYDELMANANLISAAPDLLEITQELIRHMESAPHFQNHYKVIAKAEKIIKKAKGDLK